MGFWSFKRKKTETSIEPTLLQHDIDGWYTPFTAAQLLNTELRQKYLGILWQQVSMSRDMFNNLYQAPIERYAEMVQLIPASESHHHAHLGGMLDHGLEVISFAAKLRQNYVLPQNAAPEDQSRQRDAWTAVVIYTALVHDIGKVIVDIDIQLKDGSRWLAWHGIPKLPYKFTYIKNRDYALHPVLGGFLASFLIPKSALDWLATFPDAFHAFMYAIAGHNEQAGVLNEIVQKADQHSVTLALGGDINKLVQRPIQSFAKQLVLALRHILAQKFKLNTPKGPSDGWFTEDGLWLMSKTTADQIRAYLLEQGISAPSDNRKLFDEMQALNIVEPTPEGTAIWKCRIHANSGWTPAMEFSLLRIRPEVAWENIESRPEYFAGTVIIATKETKNTNNETSSDNIAETDINDLLNAPPSTVTPVQESAVQDQPEDKLNDFVFNLFSQPAEEAQTSEKQTENTRPPKEKNRNIKKATIKKETGKDAPPIALEASAGTATNEVFIEWLKSGIKQDKFPINHPSAKLHIVQDQLFLITPSIFQLFLQESGKPYDQEAITALQYEFQAMGLHKKRLLPNKKDSVNFWKCSVIGPRKSSYLVGYLIPNTTLFFGDKILLNNQRLILLEE